MSVSSRLVIDALTQRYISAESSATNKSSEEIADYIRALAPDQLPDDHNLLDLLASEHPDWIPGAAEIAVLHSVRDCMTMIFNLIDLEPEIAHQIEQMTPVIAAELILQPGLPLEEAHSSILSIADLLLDATIGWSSDQGRAGEKLLAKVGEVIEAVRSQSVDYDSLQSELSIFLEKEQSRIRKLEDRLAASESGKLRSQKGRSLAAEMISKSMEGQNLTENITNFLKGPWYESMQLLAINKGLDGDDWIRATKLTETIIWTYQPITATDEAKANAEKQRLYRIVENLTGEIRELLLAFEHNSDELDAAIEDIEQDHILMVSGQELEYTNFDPIETNGESIGQHTSVSRILLRKVNNLEPGQWFTYDENDKCARIKLVLKLQDMKQMLFTNRNGMKALEKSYDEMAYLMSSSVIKVLNHESVFSSTFTTFYQGLIDEFERKQKLAKEADKEEADREAAREKALREAAVIAREKAEAEEKKKEEEHRGRLEQAKAEAEREENQAKVAEFNEMVDKLAIGAWLKLPAADGSLEECKLAVKITSADKLIFVSRAGVKIGEYTSEQLTTLLVAGQGEISDMGVEFEDTLAQVVTKLRADREKSYDDLTGSE